MVKSGIIYKIYDRTDKQLVYYGSTEQSISKRLDGHISDYKRYKNGKYPYVTSFLVIDANNYDIIIMETVEFGDIKELRNRERFYIENNICVNRHIPNRTQQEWCEANAEKIAEQSAEWYQKNKDKISEQHAEWYQQNKVKIAESQAEYNKVNKVKIAERKAERYQENKAKINEKFSCICGESYTYIHKSRHEKSKKHINFLAQFETAIDCVKSGVLPTN